MTSITGYTKPIDRGMNPTEPGSFVILTKIEYFEIKNLKKNAKIESMTYLN